MKRFSRLVASICGVCFAFAAPRASAELVVSSLYAGGISWGQIFGNILGTMWFTIFVVSAAGFLIGALMYTAGFISEENKSKGKNLMIGALFGLAVVLSARAIFNTAYFFVYDS